MRKLAIAAALASTAMATPAVARDKSFYAGVEGGVLWVEDLSVDYQDPFVSVKDGVILRHKSGFDIDLIAGYDFGMIRLEGELGYKRASLNQTVAALLVSGGSAGNNFDTSGRANVTSGMLNALLDFGNEDALSGYAGVGVGLADVKYRAFTSFPAGDFSFSDSYSGLAWQGILGLRYAVSSNVDVGMKYRYFNVPNTKYSGDLSGIPFDLKGNFRSHSVMLSLNYNFWAPPPPPPATQTCPDGSVILATDACPAPPPPPPPPPPAPERGL